MAETQKGGEQSMDDILASIRRIISDDPLAPVPAGNDASVKSGIALGRQVSEGPNIGLSGEASVEPVAARGPTDDLSDILQPSKVPSTQRSGGGVSGEATGGGGDKKESAATAWAFDGAVEKGDIGGSLKDKLASLDGRGQPGGLPGTSGSNERGDGTAGAARAASPDGGQLAEMRAADVERGAPDVAFADPSDVTVAAATAHSVAGAVKLSDEDVAAIPSVQAVVEQTAAEVLVAEGASVEEGKPAESQDSVTRRPDVEADQIAGIDESTGVGEDGPVASKSDGDVNLPVLETGGPDTEARGKTLESFVSEALEPRLQQWLDANLPRLVEEKVQAEIDRLSRDGKLKIG